MDPALEFCMSASVCEMRGDYNFEKRCKTQIETTQSTVEPNTNAEDNRGRTPLHRVLEEKDCLDSRRACWRPLSIELLIPSPAKKTRWASRGSLSDTVAPTLRPRF